MNYISQIPNWIQAGCAFLGVIIGFIGIKISLPKISRQMEKITDRFSRRRFDFCENCPYDPVCSSPYLDDTGVFDKKNEIENSAISEGIIELYKEIKKYQFDSQKLYTGSKGHQGCLLHKLTLAINLIGSTNMAFNMVKADKKTTAHSENDKDRGQD